MQILETCSISLRQYIYRQWHRTGGLDLTDSCEVTRHHIQCMYNIQARIVSQDMDALTRIDDAAEHIDIMAVYAYLLLKGPLL